MQAQQAGHAAGEGEDIGWQDSDSEGFINDWEVQDAAGEFDLPPRTAAPAARTASLQLQPDQQPDVQRGLGDLRDEPQQQHTEQRAADVPEQQPPEQQQLHRPLHRHIAELLHNRVVALLRQHPAGTNAGEQAAGDLDEDIALRLLTEAHQQVMTAAEGGGVQGESSDEFTSGSDDGGTGLSGDMQEATEEDAPAEGEVADEIRLMGSRRLQQLQACCGSALVKLL